MRREEVLAQSGLAGDTECFDFGIVDEEGKRGCGFIRLPTGMWSTATTGVWKGLEHSC
ncbi:MAG: hypothetical protein ACYCV0_03550 [Desulfitobacteriaceae bacterium]